MPHAASGIAGEGAKPRRVSDLKMQMRMALILSSLEDSLMRNSVLSAAHKGPAHGQSTRTGTLILVPKDLSSLLQIVRGHFDSHPISDQGL